MENRTKPWVALISHPLEGAEGFARGLVEAGLAACVQRLPIRSTYRWEGVVTTDEEGLLVVKTTAEAWERLDSFVRRAHPYSVPELLAVPVERVAEAYERWWLSEASGGGEPHGS